MLSNLDGRKRLAQQFSPNTDMGKIARNVKTGKIDHSFRPEWVKDGELQICYGLEFDLLQTRGVSHGVCNEQSNIDMKSSLR